MNEDRIERETLIAAPVDRVWSLVAQPGWWHTDDDQRTGDTARAGETVVSRNAEHGDLPVRVEKVEPPTYVAYRWVSAFPGETEVRDDNSTLVECTLTPEGDGTRLRVVETGFAGLATTDTNRANVVRDHTGGWDHCVAWAARHAEDATV